MNTSSDQLTAQAPSLPLETIVDRALEHIGRQEWTAARECLEEAIRREPGLAQLHSSLGTVLFRLQDLAASTQAFATAVALTPDDPDLWTQWALVHFQLGESAGAEAALQRSLSLRPGEPVAQRLLGDCRFAQGRPLDAAKIYGPLVDRHPDKAGTALALAQCYEAAGEWTVCRAALQLALQHEPGNAIALGSMAALSERIRSTNPRPVARTGSTLTVEVCCPSLNRLKEVIRLRNSLPDDCLFSPSLETQPRALTLIVNELFFNSTADIVIMAADHLEFKPGCLEAIREGFAKQFPDRDGVMGLNIVNLPHAKDISEFCFLALGRKFIERFYADGVYQGVFCPEYYHFYGDTEFGLFADKIGKFHYDERAAVFTWHPNAGNANRDQTYSASRSRKGYDDAMWRRRQLAGLYWGESFRKAGADNLTLETPPPAAASTAPARPPGPFGSRHAAKILGLLRPAKHVLAWGTAAAREWLAQNLPAGAELTGSGVGGTPPGKKFDFILIDGDAPAAALTSAKELLRPAGIVVLHDSQRIRHDEGKGAFTAFGHIGSCADRPGAQLWWGGLRELTGDPRAAGTLPLVICFYTKNTDYESAAQKLIASCERHHLDHRVVGLESRGSWEANCSLKSEFIHETWKASGRPVLWVDADAILHRPPNLVRGVTADFAIHRCRDWEFASGTLLFNKTPAAGVLLERWLARCRRFPQVWDQVNLDLAWEETIAVHPLESLWLPEPYCRIFDLHDGRSAEAGVIEHFQASRQLKAKVSTRPNVRPAKITESLQEARRAARQRAWQLSSADATPENGTPATSLPQMLADSFAAHLTATGRLLCLTDGPGALWDLLAQRGHEVHGLVRDKATDEAVRGWCQDRVRVGSITALPFPDGTFDGVVTTGQLELLEDTQVDLALAEIKRVARGTVFLVVSRQPDAEDRWPGYADTASAWQTRLLKAAFTPASLPGLGLGLAAYVWSRLPAHAAKPELASEDVPETQVDPATCTILVLTHDPKHPLLSSWLDASRYPVVFATNVGIDYEFPGDIGLVVTADCYNEPRATLLSRAVERGIPTLLLADGILEYRNTFEHPQIVPGAIFQPVPAHKIACLGRSQARVLESWGNAAQCEITGSARFDRYALLRRRERAAGEPFRLLVATALTPYFTPEQHAHVRRSLLDLKSFFAANAALAGTPLQVEWRITKGLQHEIGVESVVSDLSGRELADVLQRVDAVVSTPSTAMVEAMLLGLPVAVLDYCNAPHYVQPAWRITAAEQILTVVSELMAPPAPKRLFQDATLHDTLECTSPAAPRLWRLAEAMIRRGRHARANGLPLTFPARLLPVGAHDPAPVPKGYQASDLHPGHPQFHEQHLQRLQVEVGQLRVYAAQLEHQCRQSGEIARLKTYSRLSIQWRSKLEAAVALSGPKQSRAAMDLMMQALKLVGSCQMPEVTLEALLEISPHLALHDAAKARTLLEAALTLAQQMQRQDVVQQVTQLLAKPAGTPMRR
jgi:tetratricopeptide (TPR) repeat protein/SAM-dependent methyltransferase